LPLYLADSSAWRRSGARAEIADRWDSLLDAHELAVCAPVQLELLHSAGSPREYEQLQTDLDALPWLSADARAESLALRAQARLAAASQHRGPGPIDLLIAGIAAAGGATLLHYDRHFDAIAEVTGQPMEWLAPRGSLR
jgi:predicted nucleic acid-binding protein